MRKIAVGNYNIDVMKPEGKTSLSYDVKSSLITALLHPSQKMTAREVLLRNKIGDKIEEAKICFLRRGRI